MSNYVGIVSLLFMHSFAASLCSVTQQVSMWVGTFRDDTIIGWPRRELVPDAAALSCNATLFLVAWRDKKCCCDGERLIGNAFQRWYVVDTKYITTASGEPILFWVAIFLPPDCHSFRWVFKLFMQSKQSWYNLSSGRKKKYQRGNLRRQNILENL